MVLVLKFVEYPLAFGFSRVLVKFSITVLDGKVLERNQMLATNIKAILHFPSAEDGDYFDDHGWLQLVVGKFIIGGDGDYDKLFRHIEFCMEKVNGEHKGGLLLEGV